MLYLEQSELVAIIGTPGTPVLEAVAASILSEAIVKGDQQRLEFVLQRMIGKVQDRLEVTLPKPFIVTRLDGSTVEMGAKLGPKQTDNDEAE